MLVQIFSVHVFNYKIMRKVIIVFFTLINLSFVQAQVSSDAKRVADVYFLNKEYYAAAEYYKKALQISPDSLGFIVPHGFDKKIQEESPKKNDYEYAVFQLGKRRGSIYLYFKIYNDFTYK